ncbi:MAG TPA: type II toxin-antitoxin system RelE/ParE family toxin [Bryobacteraceae bacterium]|nr:type II toxin-antitoxin system RelE/ParE family toxin [Bryobacteraceae bacterium]
MTRAVVFRPIARSEYDEAVAWYESERAGLGLEFKDAVDGVLARIAAMPLVFRAVRGPVRRAVVKRFPYTIHFLNEADRIVVLAVYHAARDPEKLESRR